MESNIKAATLKSIRMHDLKQHLLTDENRIVYTSSHKAA
jgi:hypothetical protein